MSNNIKPIKKEWNCLKCVFNNDGKLPGCPKTNCPFDEDEKEAKQ